jgi:Brp/Blh family beta-carotene 15,15'-monooxygenase
MATDSDRWLGPALSWQALAAGLAVAACSVLAVFGLPFGLGFQIGVLLTGIVLVGFPHGAFDHLVARPILAPRLGRFWWVPFGLAYVGLAGLVCLAWALAPLPTLVLFLAGSVVHFGLGDIEDGAIQPAVPRWAAVIIHGALPILLPIAFHPAEAAPVLAAIGGVAEPAMLAALSISIWLVPLWVGALAWMWHATRPPRPSAILTVITAVGFVTLPPLLAFGLYFGMVHSPLHLLRLADWYDPCNPRRAARWAARVVMPAGLACALGIAALAITAPDASIGILVPMFRLIAALTLPHMIVTTWLGHDGQHGPAGSMHPTGSDPLAVMCDHEMHVPRSLK